VHRLIRELRPRWVVCENVSGHIKLGLDEVLSTLEAEGYTCWPFIIPACSVDAPHKRDRVWIVGNAQHDGLLAAPLRGEPQEVGRGSSQGQEPTEQSARAGGRKDNGNVADTTGQLGKRRTEEQVYGVGDIPEQLRGSGTDFRDGWPVEPNVGRVADGVPARSHRIKALGNAVVPQIPEAIGRVILKVEGLI
jgi:DNA (cytosine-5)-methyltransferase 1